MSILPHTICADTPRPSETGNMSTSVDSAGNVTQQNDPIVDHLLTLSNLTASIISQSQNLPPWQAAALKESASAMLSAVGGESKNKPVDLATSPPSSDQDKSSWVNGPKCPDPTIQDTGRKILLEPHGENILSCSTSGGQMNEALLTRTKAALSAICLAPVTFTVDNIINYEATNKKDLITSLNEAGNGAHFKDKGFIFSFNACDLNNRDGMLRIAGTLSEFVIARLKLYPDIFTAISADSFTLSRNGPNDQMIHDTVLRLVQALDNAFAQHIRKEVKQADIALQPLLEAIGFIVNNPCIRDIGTTGKFKKILDLVITHKFLIPSETLYQKQKDLNRQVELATQCAYLNFHTVAQLCLDVDQVMQQFSDNDLSLPESEFSNPITKLRSLVNQGVHDDDLQILKRIEEFLAECTEEILKDRARLFDIGIQHQAGLDSWRIRNKRPALRIPQSSVSNKRPSVLDIEPKDTPKDAPKDRKPPKEISQQTKDFRAECGTEFCKTYNHHRRAGKSHDDATAACRAVFQDGCNRQHRLVESVKRILASKAKSKPGDTPSLCQPVAGDDDTASP